MIRSKTILVCKKVKFYSDNDEAAFFEWINKNDAIDETSGRGDELYLHMACKDLHDHDLRDLIALFFRYKIEMTQLSIFLNERNKAWFFENSKAYWHKKVFGVEKK